MKILVLGGDERSIYAAKELSREHDVKIYAVNEYDIFPDSVSDCALLGLPCSKDGKRIYAPASDIKPDIAVLKTLVKKGGLILGGMTPPQLEKFCDDNGFVCADYYDDESVVLKNAVPSAEGALSTGINETKGMILGMRVLVLGYGRIASLLCGYLRALGAEVTVAARNAEKRTLAQTRGCRAVDFSITKNIADNYELIYNTVPAEVISGEEARKISRGTVYIELASVYGIDKRAAEDSGVKIVDARGLPAKTAPCAAGKIIADKARRLIKAWSVSERNIHGG